MRSGSAAFQSSTNGRDQLVSGEPSANSSSAPQKTATSSGPKDRLVPGMLSPA